MKDPELQKFLNILFEIPLLNRENYFIWKPLIKDFLINFNLWNFVTGKEKKPSKSEEKDYDYRKRKAYTAIHDSISNEVQPWIREENPKKLWEVLIILFDKENGSIDDLEDKVESMTEKLQEKEQVVGKLQHLNQNLIKEICELRKEKVSFNNKLKEIEERDSENQKQKEELYNNEISKKEDEIDQLRKQNESLMRNFEENKKVDIACQTENNMSEHVDESNQSDKNNISEHVDENIQSDENNISDEKAKIEKKDKRIGLRILEKMGYNGGGLGKNNQGITTPIEIKEKRNMFGIGYQGNIQQNSCQTHGINSRQRENHNTLKPIQIHFGWNDYQSFAKINSTLRTSYRLVHAKVKFNVIE